MSHYSEIKHLTELLRDVRSYRQGLHDDTSLILPKLRHLEIKRGSSDSFKNHELIDVEDELCQKINSVVLGDSSWPFDDFQRKIIRNSREEECFDLIDKTFDWKSMGSLYMKKLELPMKNVKQLLSSHRLADVYYMNEQLSLLFWRVPFLHKGVPSLLSLGISYSPQGAFRAMKNTGGLKVYKDVPDFGDSPPDVTNSIVKSIMKSEASRSEKNNSKKKPIPISAKMILFIVPEELYRNITKSSALYFKLVEKFCKPIGENGSKFIYSERVSKYLYMKSLETMIDIKYNASNTNGSFVSRDQSDYWIMKAVHFMKDHVSDKPLKYFYER